MLTVVCVKWGTKYGPKYVYNLRTMVQRNLTHKHNFVCLTDDPTDINCDTILFPENNDLETYWNKMYLFKRDMLKGKCVYFDLDIVIQNNIDEIVNYTDKLTGVYTYWNDLKSDGSYPYAILKWKVPFNSSVMAWTAEDYYWVWDKFDEDRDWHIIKYYGDDKFLGNEIKNKGTFPDKWIYSRLYGSKEKDTPNEILKLYRGYSEGLYNFPEYKICLFNGPTDEKYYKGFEKYWS